MEMRQNLSRFFTLLLSFLLIFLTFSPVLAQTESRLVRVGIYDNPPKIYTDENGKVTGVFADILEFIAAEENWQLQYVPGTFDEGLKRVRSGEIDIMVDVAFNEERAAVYDLSHETVLSSWGVVYVHKDSDIRSIQDLEGKTVALLESSVYYDGTGGVKQYVSAFGLHLNYINSQEYSDIFKLLSEKKVDAAVVSRISGLTAETTYPDIKPTDIIFKPTELRFALTKGGTQSQYLIERLDYWVAQLRNGQGETYRSILEKHNLLGLTPEIEVVPAWVQPFALGSGIALLLFAALTVIFNQIRKTAQDALGVSEEKFRSIVLSMSEGVVVQGKDGTILAVNPAAERMFGSTSQKIIGKTLNDIFENSKIIQEDGSPFPVETRPFLITQHTGKPQRNKVLGFYNVDDELIWISMSVQPLLSKNKLDYYAVVVTFHDITDQKKLEQHRTELDELKTKFIHIIAHQLRTPLGVIRWNLEMLLENLPKGITAKQKESLMTIYSEDTTIIARIGELLNIVRIEENKLTLTTEVVDVMKLFQKVAKEKSVLAEKKSITYRILGDKKAQHKIKTDEMKIRSVVERLIDNAITYTPENGSIDINFSVDGNTVRFEVSDTGIGIPATEQPKVFNKFFRGEKAPQIEPNSFGLGLYISKNYIEALGGKIGFTSKENQGSTFWFEL